MVYKSSMRINRMGSL